MTDRVQLEIPILLHEGEALEDAIADLIKENEKEFLPLFERLVDCGDANISVLDDSLTIMHVDVSKSGGVASVTFTSHYFAPCKDMRSIDDHDEGLEFEIINNHLVFDIELPPIWAPH